MKKELILKKTKECIEDGDERVLEKMLARLQVHDHPKIYYWAIESLNLRIVKMLSENVGVESAVNAQSGSTPLHIAARKAASINVEECSHLLNIVNFLIDQTANLDVKDVFGRTPLMYSVSKQIPCISGEITRVLIERGASPDIIDNLGLTALHYACDYRNREAVEFLIYGGADPYVVDLSGKRPLDYALYDIKDLFIALISAL